MNNHTPFDEDNIPFMDELPVAANRKSTKGDWDGELLGTHKRKHLKVVDAKEAIQASKFAPLSLSQVLAMPPQQFIVSGLLPKKGLVVWYGAPACGKTFLALDLAMALSTNQPEWFGHEMQGGHVIYVAGEGLGGLSNRLRSWVEDNNTAVASIEIVPTPPNLFAGEADEFAQAIASSKPIFLVVDTLARSSVGGDENSARDMGKVIEACDLLTKRLDCCVLLIHHAGRAGWERGSTALRGAADVMLEVKKHDDGTRELVLNGQSAKIKDGAESESIFFKLEPFGESCIVTPAEPAEKKCRRPMPKGSNQRLVYELAGQALKERSGVVEGRPTITFEQLHKRWLGAVVNARNREPGSLRRILRPMLDAEILGGDESAIWCP